MSNDKQPVQPSPTLHVLKESSKATPRKQKRLLLEQLEPRKLFDAALAPEVPVDPIDIDQAQIQQVQNISETGSKEQVSGRQLVFIDSKVDQAGEIVGSIYENYQNDSIEVVFVDEDTDGFLQLTETLAGQSNIAAVHIISHGADGQIHLGNASINSQNVRSEYGDYLAIIGESLAEDGDILIYGCNVAATESGEAFVHQLAELTGADIAASTDLTGNEIKGGDWDLELNAGRVDVGVLHNVQYGGVLVDTDGDGVDDADDVDDDNDGILDVDEGLNGTISTTLVYDAAASGADTIVLTDGTYTVTITNNVGASFSGSSVVLNNGNAPESIQFSANFDFASVNFASLNDFDRNNFVDAIALDQTGTWTNLGNLNGTDELVAYTLNNAGETQATLETGETVSFTDLQNAGAQSSVLLNPAAVEQHNYFADFVFDTATNSFILFGDDVVKPANQSTSLAFASMNVEIRVAGIDSDNDGIFDHLDLDSDNDGIADNIEAQSTAGYVAPSGIYGTNGLDTAYSSGLSAVDTDNDGIADFRDTDSDNDGVLDVDESGFSSTTDATYADVNGSLDDPANQLAETFDTSELDFREAGIDSDGDRVSDALDLDDDNDGILDSEENGTPVAFTETTAVFRIPEEGGSSTQSIDLSAFNIEIGSTVTVSNVLAEGDLNSSTEFFLLNFNSGEFVTGQLNTGSQSQGMRSVVQAVNATITVIDIGGGVAGITIQGTSSNAVNNFGNLDGVQYQLDIDGVSTFVDTDGDGIKDRLDLDSDNDGISDIEEAGHDPSILDTNNDGIIDDMAGAANDANSNGLSDSAEAVYGVGTGVAPRDTDGDLIDDRLDLDSDNDGIADNVEAQETGIYVAPDGSVDSWGRDINGLFVPTDTDGDGVADYLDSDSDNDGTDDVNESGLTLTGTDNDNDGIDDGVNASYADVNGDVNDPWNDLLNVDGFADRLDFRGIDLNEAPYLNRSGNFALNGIDEDVAINDGTTVADILGSSPGSHFDANGDTLGIAVVDVDNTNGTWQYSLDGATWLDVGSVDSTNALLLEADDSLRFVPDADWHGSLNVGFVAWDQTSGSAGGKTDVTGGGGARSSFSHQGLLVETYKSSGTVSDLDDADQTIAYGTLVGQENHNHANTHQSGGNGNFGDANSIPGLPGVENDFVVRTSGVLRVDVAGTYTFGATSDDGSRLRIDLNQDGVIATDGSEDVILDDSLHAPVDVFGTPINLSTGEYQFEWVWFERGGGATGELYYAQGSHSSFNSNFALVGDDAGGIGVVTGAATAVLTVNSVADVVDDSDSLDEDSDVDIDVLANDTYSGTANVTSVTQGTNGSVVINSDGTVKYTPNADYHGTDSFTYTVTDDHGLTETATVTLTILPVGDVTSDTISTDEDSPVTFNVLANDNFDGLVTLTGVTGATNGSLAFTSAGEVTYTPDADFNGSETLTYTITEDNGSVETGTVTITVNAVSDIADDSVSVDEDTSIDIDVLSNDTYSLASNVTSVTQGTFGTVAINPDGTVRYSANADYHGSDSFTYTVTDVNGDTETATVTVTINPVSDVTSDSVSTDEDAPVTFNVLSNDSFEGAATLTNVTGAANGSVTFNAAGEVTYTPNADFNGSETLTYTITEDDGSVEIVVISPKFEP